MTNGRTGAVLEHRERRTEGQEIVMSQDIVGKRLTNPEGYDLGEIANLRINLQMSRVEYAVLRHGGVLGMGGKHFAIPLEAMIYRPGDDVFVANIDKETLDSQRGFSEGNWPYEANWSLIRTTRPLAPPRLDEARAVAERTEPPPAPEIVTTERTEVIEKGAPEEKPVEAKPAEAEPVREVYTPPPPERTEMRGEGIVQEQPPEIKPAETEMVRPERVETREEAAVQEQPLEERQVPVETVEAAEPAKPSGPTEERLVTEAEAYGPPTAVEEVPGERPAAEERREAGKKVYGPPLPEGEEVIVEETVIEEQVVETYPETREEAIPEERVAMEEQPVVEAIPETREAAVPEEREGGIYYMSSTELLTFLSGTDYPADKGTLLDRARRNNAPSTAINALERFEEKTYFSPMEVSHEYNRIKSS